MLLKDEKWVKDAATAIGDVIADDVMGVPFAGNLVAAAKSKLQDEYVSSYPTIALIGEPASGKTTIAESAVMDRSGQENNVKYEVTGRYSAKKLANIISQNDTGYIIIDDFARFESSDTKRRMNDILDTVIRLSYGNKKASQLLITAEMNVLENVTDSLKTRMIMINVNGWKERSESKHLINELRNNRNNIVVLLDEFNKWIEEKDSLSIAERKKNFDSENSKMGDRARDNFFVIDVSVQLFTEFMQERYKSCLKIKQFRVNYKKIWEENDIKSLSDEKRIYRFLKEIFEFESFKILSLEPEVKCFTRCRGFCKDDNCWGRENYVEECDCSEYKDDKIYYDSHKLYIDTDNELSILIKDTKYLYSFPRYSERSMAILIVEAEQLLKYVNAYLADYCYKYHVRYSVMNLKELSETLRKLNICMYNDDSGKPVYRLKNYPSLTEDKSVYILKLNTELFEIVNNKANKIDAMFKFGRNYRMLNNQQVKKLNNFWKKLSWFYGECE